MRTILTVVVCVMLLGLTSVAQASKHVGFCPPWCWGTEPVDPYHDNTYLNPDAHATMKHDANGQEIKKKPEKKKADSKRK